MDFDEQQTSSLSKMQIVPGRILNFLVLGTDGNDSNLFIQAFLSKIPDAQLSAIPPAMSMTTVAVQWGSEVLCVNLTRISSAARLASSSTFAYERADGVIFITSSPSIDNVQILTRWRKEINSRTPSNSMPAIFVIQRSENQKMQEKAASTMMIKERGFKEVIQILTRDSEYAQSVVKHLIWHVMGNEPKHLTNAYGVLLAAASKGATTFGNLF
ncbi:hypothetical protein TRFO_11980 [Tritrichomonas foetus]|uniref:Ras family protein n=1 Tax=Tritrichomonas foetus TaxID=1144522 RepID=A0A1J4J349_9EUKA|nr:hypothetical protein TRFO_11980 [Tritrichomonas foetus]|eukprot:OHS93169.1 hypothetical protein TRFO_11980 [Tritrichomonas foetus]